MTVAAAGGERVAWLGALAATIGCHLAVSVAFPQSGWTTSAGIGGVNLVALLLCLSEARMARRSARWRWLLLAAAFLLWIGAFAALAVLQTVLHTDFSDVHMDSMFFMLRGAPLLLLVSRTGESDDSTPFRLIDLAQAALFGVLVAALLFPRVIGQLGDGALVADRLGLLYHEVQNYGLAAFAVLSFAGQTQRESRRVLGLLCWLLLSYAVMASVVNHWIIRGFAPPPGSPWFLLGDMPQASFIVLAVVSRRTAHGTDREPGRIVEGVRILQPVLFCAALLALAFAIGRENFAIGMVAGFMALALYAARSTVMQLRLLQVQHQLAISLDRQAVLAERDTLTGLPNRRSLDERLVADWRRVARTETQLAILLIDVDEFKGFNDNAGHLAGDQCLREVAQVMRTCIRHGDNFLARFGGEEFVVLAPFIGGASAMRLAETLRKAVEDFAYPHPGNASGIVTVSVGAAVSAPSGGDIGPEELLREADAALYRAKSLGRNRVELTL